MACVLYAHLKFVWKQQLVSQYRLKISNKKKEMSLNYYRTFLPNVDINIEVEKFLLDPLRCYDSEVCDVFLLALGYTYRVNVRIYQPNVNECWVTDLSIPSNYFQLSLYFARSLPDHLDPIIKKKITSKNWVTRSGKKCFNLCFNNSMES